MVCDDVCVMMCVMMYVQSCHEEVVVLLCCCVLCSLESIDLTESQHSLGGGCYRPAKNRDLY